MNWSYFFRLFIDYKYPDDIIKILNAKYKVIRVHKKKIKNIEKSSNIFTLFGFKFGDLYDLNPKDMIRIKRHRYIINKTKKDIKGIREHYKKVIWKK